MKTRFRNSTFRTCGTPLGKGQRVPVFIFSRLFEQRHSALLRVRAAVLRDVAALSASYLCDFRLGRRSGFRKESDSARWRVLAVVSESDPMYASRGRPRAGRRGGRVAMSKRVLPTLSKMLKRRRAQDNKYKPFALKPASARSKQNSDSIRQINLQFVSGKPRRYLLARGAAQVLQKGSLELRKTLATSSFVDENGGLLISLEKLANWNTEGVSIPHRDLILGTRRRDTSMSADLLCE
eukprot:scaffold733_cov267-Pinguiococcus_pyrenoidosus.AAC.14